jgi:hypothetical protein
MLETRVIAYDGRYNAFTGLCHHQQYFWLAYREGSGHVSPDGAIRLLRSRDGARWEPVARLTESGVDLRDPRLCVLGGDLWILCFSLTYDRLGSVTHRPGDSFWFRVTGTGIDPPLHFAYDEHQAILWAAVQTPTGVIATGYDLFNGHSTLHIFSAPTPRGPWERIATVPDVSIPPNLGFNEADICVEADGSLRLLVRIDRTKKRSEGKGMLRRHIGAADWVGIATAPAPYTEWRVATHRTYLKGPRIIRRGESYLAVGRFVQSSRKGRRLVSLFEFREGHDPLPLLTLASGQDGSYAGLCWDPEDPDVLCISYYSDHAREGTPLAGKANDVYFARVRITD